MSTFHLKWKIGRSLQHLSSTNICWRTNHWNLQATDNVRVVQKLLEPPEQTIEPKISLANDGTTLKRSIRTKRLAIPNDYEMYLQESDYSIGAKIDIESFSNALSCKVSEWMKRWVPQKVIEFGFSLSCLVM